MEMRELESSVKLILVVLSDIGSTLFISRPHLTHFKYLDLFDSKLVSIPATSLLVEDTKRISGDGGQETGGQDAAEEMGLLDTSGDPVKY